jgi:hypothetical protein
MCIELRRASAACLAILCTIVLPTGSASGQGDLAVTMESGAGDGMELWRVGVQGEPRKLKTVGSWMATLAWELQLGKWNARDTRSAGPSVWDLGITPLVRLEEADGGRWTAFLEGAVGAHLISRNKVHRRLDMSSAYQFGDHLGVGVRFRWVEVVFRHQHLSNASFVQPNHGANFSMLRVVYYLP